MNKKTRLKIKMFLESDAILGSGYSIPGEEDIGVCKDEKGYPYMKGSTFKGLLRESMENLAFWINGDTDRNTNGATDKDTNEDINGLEQMLGEEGWNEESEERRIHLTSLKLENPPADPEECYEMRTFTSLENGVIRKGTLRTAVCISGGNVFLGELTCKAEDVEFVKLALKGIKYVGTLRNRGFGKVKITYETTEVKSKNITIAKTNCIHYRLRSELPLVMTDPTRSKGYHYETLGYIPGSAIRGMVVSYLTANEPEWFEKNKAEILRKICFLDAVPSWKNKTVLPSIKGFYEKKDGSAFQSVLTNGELSPGVKRAGMGTFCTIENEKIYYWTAETAGTTRIRKEKNDQEKLMFQSHYLCENQEFEGYILLPDEEFAQKISAAFQQDIWVGADRFSGNGKCEVTLLEGCDAPKWRSEFGYSGDMISENHILYLLAVSPFCMLDDKGNPCGFNEKELAQKLGIEDIKIEFCSTSVSDFRTYNRIWKCSSPTVRMYDRGSIFKLKCSEFPEKEKLLLLQSNGIGIRKAEGFGQILFLRPDIYEKIKGKEAANADKNIITNKSINANKSINTIEDISKTTSSIIALRRAKYLWVMENAKHPERWKGGLSASQIGEIQGLLEKAAAKMRTSLRKPLELKEGSELDELKDYFVKNREKLGVRHGAKFKATEQFIKGVLKTPLEDLLEVKELKMTEPGMVEWKATQSKTTDRKDGKTGVLGKSEKLEKIELLCMLFDYSRKGGRDENGVII